MYNSMNIEIRLLRVLKTLPTINEQLEALLMIVESEYIHGKLDGIDDEGG